MRSWLPVLSLDQPWAQALFIIGVDGRPLKQIETRGLPLNGSMRPDGVRGLPGLRVNKGDLIGLASTKNKPTLGEVGTSGWKAFPGELSHYAEGVEGAPGSPVPFTFGRLNGAARVTGCLPIVEQVAYPGEPHPVLGEVDHIGRDEAWPGDLFIIRYTDTAVYGDTINGEHPWGDYRPGRFGIVLDDIAATTERCPACEGSCGDLVCPRCRGSASLPLGMSCSDHQPRGNCPVCEGRGVCDPVNLDDYVTPTRQGVFKLDFERRKEPT